MHHQPINTTSYKTFCVIKVLNFSSWLHFCIVLLMHICFLGNIINDNWWLYYIILTLCTRHMANNFIRYCIIMNGCGQIVKTVVRVTRQTNLLLELGGMTKNLYHGIFLNYTGFTVYDGIFFPHGWPGVIYLLLICCIKSIYHICKRPL